MMTRTFTVLSLVCILLTACDRNDISTDIDQDQPAAVEAKEIQWFDGGVEEAFRIAAETDTPVYLYWGAVWCPPCQEIKHTVFKSKDFIALSNLFIPVYLDGDTKQAQAVGERFGVQGYPTMIVFNPRGEEITRIPGGIDISRYNSVLELSLNQMQPTAELVRLARTDPDSLDKEDFTQLAWYSWGQDFNVLEEDSSFTLFKELAELASRHDEVASARLYMQYLAEASSEHSEEAPVSIEGAYEKLTNILSSDELVLACWDTLAWWPEITEILDLDDKQRQELKTLWAERILAMRHHPSLSTAEQLAGWLPLLEFHYSQTDDPLAHDVEMRLREDLEAANRKTTNVFARQSVVNQIKFVYQQAKMFDEARALLLAELEKSAAPYYFMSSLGSLEEKQENYDEAVDWYRKAYVASEGTATRFQWGANYVRAMIRMHPDDHDAIVSTSESLFQELDDESEVFTGRNFRVLRSLKGKLESWQGADAAGHRRFITRIEQLCERQPQDTLARENCLSLTSAGTG